MSGVAPARDAQVFLQFICKACGLVYDEALGDPDSGLAPGTRFQDIPDDWMCPVCGVGKDDFEPWVVTARAAPPAPRLRVVAGSDAKPIVIVGAGAAGWAVASALRRRAPQVPIVMLSGCSGAVYAKPMLSVAIAHRRRPEALLTESGEDAARALNLRLVTEAWLTGIDRRHRNVRTTKGSFAYRALVLALGAAPLPLPLDAESQALVWRINHHDHYRRFRAALEGELPTPRKTVAVIGAGLVGCELADDIASAGHDVSLIDLNSQPLATLADSDTAEAFVARLAINGVHFVGGVLVRRVRRHGAQFAVTLASRADTEPDAFEPVVIADHVIAATGLAVEPRLARMIGVRFDNGFAVDAQTMATSDPAIHALGDCASFEGRTCRFIEPIHRQADVIADRLCGIDSPGFVYKPAIVRLKSRTMPMSFTQAR